MVLPLHLSPSNDLSTVPDQCCVYQLSDNGIVPHFVQGPLVNLR